ncbi:MAG: redox-regulated ATPase YchF, partial [Clostridia bacterium]|nr:redox-regulated ATPase YchF [Clostridia bacterium]
AIVHVVRCFNDENVTHVDNSVDPLRDIETINLELIFADTETVGKKLEKAQSLIKTGDKKYKTEAEFLERLYPHLNALKPARTLSVSDDEKEYLKSLFLLTAKPVIYTANIGEKDMGKKETDIPLAKQVIDFAKAEKAEYMVICAKTEEELSALPDDEKKLFLSELGETESGLDRLIKTSYRLLGLISYLTAGEKEVRAWTIEKGTKAPQAAGKIHSDFEKGFIRAEIVDYDVLKELGSFNAAKEKGKVRSEGKDYVVKDGDVVLFRFNV